MAFSKKYEKVSFIVSYENYGVGGMTGLDYIVNALEKSKELVNDGVNPEFVITDWDSEDYQVVPDKRIKVGMETQGCGGSHLAPQTITQMRMVLK